MSEPQASRPGSILRAEREALGVTVREVSETLNLSMAMIEAIEADDLERLPGPVFARGYVRAYARLLELDPEPLVSCYPKPQAPLPAAARPESPVWEWIRQRPVLVLGCAAGALLVLIVLLVIWLWPSEAAPPAVSRGDLGAGAESAPELDVGAPAAADRDPVPVAVAAPYGAGGAGRDGSTTGEAAPFPAIGPAHEERASWSQERDADSAAIEARGAVVHRITDPGEERLAFTFTDDCWVEVRDAGGGNLFSDLGRGGTRLVLLGEGPFHILLGYAPGVELAYNGEPLPLAPHTRNNVATLVLGQ